jgi:hypothetical protein
MSTDDFKSIIDKLPAYVRIDFSGMSEPFTNPSCIDFIQYAITKPNPIAIYTTLVGANPESVNILSRSLKASRFKMVVIHLPDDSGKMSGFKLTPNYLNAINILAPMRRVSMMTMSPNAKILPSLQEQLLLLPNSNQIMRKLPTNPFVGLRRAGSLNTDKIDEKYLFAKTEWENAISCRITPFYDHNVVLPDGRVLLCCMDYAMKHVIGNLLESDYVEIFESKEMGVVRSSNMSIESAIKRRSICTYCDIAICWKPSEDALWTRRDIPPPRVSLKNQIRRKIASTYASFMRLKFGGNEP